MTLLEMLKEHWKEWPANMTCVFQLPNGCIYACGGSTHAWFQGRLPVATDFSTAVVTELEWKAVEE